MNYINMSAAYMPIIYLIAIMLIIALVIKGVKAIVEFVSIRNQIKMEIQRSYSTDEKLYWEKQMKRLYKSYIPFYMRTKKKHK